MGILIKIFTRGKRVYFRKGQIACGKLDGTAVTKYVPQLGKYFVSHSPLRKIVMNFEFCECNHAREHQATSASLVFPVKDKLAFLFFFFGTAQNSDRWRVMMNSNLF